MGKGKAVVIAGGAVAAAYALSKQGEPEAPAGVPGGALKRSIAGFLAQRAGGVYTGTPDPKYKEPSPWGALTTEGYAQEVLDAVIARLKKKWDELGAAAKQEACSKLKEQFPDDPGIQALECDKSTFSQILTVTAGAVGFYYGGPVGSAVAVIAVTILQEDIGQWLSDAWESFAHREGIGGPFEEQYWGAQCYAAEHGSDEALLEILTFQEEDALTWCLDHGYAIGGKV
jgi:hypothetical protein